MDSKLIKRFDQVRLLTTRRINYVHAPAGTELSPKGIWSVAGIVNNSDLLCVQNTVTIKVPIADVLKVADYDIDSITRDFGKLAHGQKPLDGRSGGNQQEDRIPDSDGRQANSTGPDIPE